jgi:hypothetical protein
MLRRSGYLAVMKYFLATIKILLGIAISIQNGKSHEKLL